MSIGIFGGTFNPVHLGHLTLVKSLLSSLPLSEIRFLPTATPPHKICNTSIEHRIKMLALALQNEKQMCLDLREIQRGGISYTIDTLRSLRQELGNEIALCFIIGMDPFNDLDTWHEWEAIPALANLIVCDRAGVAKDPFYNQKITQQFILTTSPLDLQKAHGHLFFHQATTLNISSSQIRAFLHASANNAEASSLVPAAVWNYIQENNVFL